MADAWQILRDGGLPLAAPRTTHRRSPHELARAVCEAIAEQPRGREAEALAAFVLAWHQHWPSSFERELDDAAVATVQWARQHTSDANRYLKLRRIALENLATVL